MSENASNDGFLLAGAYYVKLSAIQDLVNRSSLTVPTASGAKASFGIHEDLYAKTVLDAYKTLKSSAIGNANFGPTQQQMSEDKGFWSTVSGFIGNGLDFTDIIKKIFNSSSIPVLL